ncbi:hypothetical protein IWW45_001927 [Coemansia sp. RSA 485]|nr:hypothetical protein IWW45_001927 [Coemansia sp. RSA 485]
MPAGPFGGFIVPKPQLAYRVLSKTLGATMWFWMMYRIKEDGAVAFGFRHPWDHHDDHGSHDNHGDHGHKENGGH